MSAMGTFCATIALADSNGEQFEELQALLMTL